MLKNDPSSKIKKVANQILLPRLVISQAPVPYNLTRTGSLNNLALPKLSSRSEISLSPPLLSSPVQSHKKEPSKVHKSPSMPSLNSSVRSNKTYGAVHYYCANTNKGLIREYNEDRVMIILRIPKPDDKKFEKWPPCSFFGLYDSHGGKNCSIFLRDNLHLFITQSPYFPADPLQAILTGFEKAENAFLDLALKKRDKSGSCAIIALVIGKKCFVANLGDSRAVVSSNNGSDCVALTNDHKPNDANESQRILKNGGEVYYSSQIGNSVCRVLPGRLAVSRAFGDFEAKLKEFGGNPNVLIAVPDVRVFSISKTTDFVLLGSDGIFDRLSNREIVDIFWNIKAPRIDPLDKLTKGVENVILEAMNRESFDNVTVLVVAFENFANSTLKIE